MASASLVPRPSFSHMWGGPAVFNRSLECLELLAHYLNFACIFSHSNDLRRTEVLHLTYKPLNPVRRVLIKVSPTSDSSEVLLLVMAEYPGASSQPDPPPSNESRNEGTHLPQLGEKILLLYG